MSDKICLITGASSGIGFAAATELARRGITVVLLCRDRDRGEKAKAEIAAVGGSENVGLLSADLSSPKQIRRAVTEYTARYDRLDILVNNAAIVPKRSTLTEDGLEMQFAVNHLAPFLLTNLLLETLRASAPSRIVTVSSGMHGQARVDLSNLQAEKKYKAMSQYAVTKLLNIYFTYELARRLEGTRVAANCLAPGLTATGIARDFSPFTRFFFRKFGKPKELGAETVVYLAISEEVEGVSGKYFENMKAVRSSIRSGDREAARKVWEISARLAGLG